MTNPNTSCIVASSQSPRSFILTRSSYSLQHVLFQLQHPPERAVAGVLKWMQWFHLKVCVGTASPASSTTGTSASSQRRTILQLLNKIQTKGRFVACVRCICRIENMCYLRRRWPSLRLLRELYSVEFKRSAFHWPGGLWARFVRGPTEISQRGAHRGPLEMVAIHRSVARKTPARRGTNLNGWQLFMLFSNAERHESGPPGATREWRRRLNRSPAPSVLTSGEPGLGPAWNWPFLNAVLL